MMQENIVVDMSSHHESEPIPSKPQHEIESTDVETSPTGSKSSDGSVNSSCTSVTAWNKKTPTKDNLRSSSSEAGSRVTVADYKVPSDDKVTQANISGTILNHDTTTGTEVKEAEDGDSRTQISATIFSDTKPSTLPGNEEVTDDTKISEDLNNNYKTNQPGGDGDDEDSCLDMKPRAASSESTPSFPPSSELDASNSNARTLQQRIEEKVSSGRNLNADTSPNKERLQDLNRRINEKVQNSSGNLKSDTSPKQQRLNDLNRRINDKVNSSRTLQSESSASRGSKSLEALNKRINEKVNSNRTLRSESSSHKGKSLETLNKRINDKVNSNRTINSGITGRTRSVEELNKRIYGKVNSNRTLMSDSSSSRGRTLEDLNRRLHEKVNSNRTLKSDSSSSREKSLQELDRRIDGKMNHLPPLGRGFGGRMNSNRSLFTATESETSSSRDRSMHELDKRLGHKFHSSILSTSSNRSYASGRSQRKNEKRVSWNYNHSQANGGSSTNSAIQGFNDIGGNAGNNAWDFYCQQNEEDEDQGYGVEDIDPPPLTERRHRSRDDYMRIARPKSTTSVESAGPAHSNLKSDDYSTAQYSTTDHRSTNSSHASQVKELLPVADPVAELGNSAGTVALSYGSYNRSNDGESLESMKSTTNHTMKIWLGLAIALALIIGITVPLVMSKSSKTTISVDLEGELSPSFSPTEDRRQHLPSFFAALLLVSSRQELLDKNAPQSKALTWLVFEDDLRLIPSIDGPHGELFQRYALLVLHFSQKNGIDRGSWADPSLHECDWGYLKCEQIESANEDEGKNFVSSFSDDHVNKWVTSHQTGPTAPFRMVTGINLKNTGMDGTLVNEIGLLSNLKFLNIARNTMSGPLPYSIYSLTHLEELWIEENNIGGSIDPRIGNLTSLTKLSVHDCDLTGSIPETLKQLSNLELLYTHDNKLKGNILEIMTSLPNLATTNNGRNKFSGTIPILLGSLSKLEYLDASYSDYSGTIPNEIGELTNLRYLSLQYNSQINGELPYELGNMKNLEGIRINNCQLRGRIPTSLGRITKLRILDLSYNYISDTLPDELSNLADLVQLALHDNRISGLIPEDYRKLINLEQLYIQDNKLSKRIDANSGICELRGNGKLKRFEADCSVCTCCTKCY